VQKKEKGQIITRLTRDEQDRKRGLTKNVNIIYLHI